MDPRVASARSLLTGPRLLAGHGTGLIRPHNVARLLGVPLVERSSLLAWIEAQELYVEPPTAGPLHLKPTAGCVEAARLREALKKAAAVPFNNNVGLPVEVTP